MSDEVSDFLRSVEQLKGRREEEDEARSRELEEKILQERRERQARREERARSISPQKSSPANTPPPSSHRSKPFALDGLSLASSPTPGLSPSPKSRALPAPDAMDASPAFSSPTKENEAPFEVDSKRTSAAAASPPSAGTPTRTPTLSWQRRPTSQASDRPRSRPLSMVAAENAAARSSTPAAEPPERGASRDQIAQALASKDPAWFRQTADRGQSSPAYRRNQVGDEDRLAMSSVPVQLPGMSRTPLAEVDGGVADDHPSSPSFHGKLGSPLPLTSAQRLDPPPPQATEEPPSPRPSSPGRSSPTRPVSPTKGAGGFVQSAMMKRTDSVKRWSVTSPGGLQRAGSNRNSRDLTDRLASPQSVSPARPTSMIRESSPRPASSHGREALSVDTAKPEAEPEKTTPPTSPSKTMDPRRWSPTKTSSWLEAALNKPESPKPKPAAPPSHQPAWMVELNKAKAHKASNSSVDLGRPGTVAPTAAPKHEVKTGGLLRSTAPGTAVKPPALAATSSALSSPPPVSDKPATPGFRDQLAKPGATTESSEETAESLDKKPVLASPPALKPKPETPPKKDFRAILKPSQPGAGPSTEPVNELQNVFGKLRRAKIQNYVAPDELKDNILRGKAALNNTGGPRPSEKKDELKDAILKRKDEFKKAQQEGRGVTRHSSTAAEKPIPEGLAKKLELGRSSMIALRRDSTASSPSPGAASKSPEPVQPGRPGPSRLDASRQSASTASSAENETPEAISSPVAPPKVADQPSRTSGPVSGSALANRFNPALAGLLARGPPGAGSAPPRGAGETTTSGGPSSGGDKEAAPGPQLTHMTKNRARGPRRKAPTSIATSAEPETPASPPAAKEKPASVKTPRALSPTTPNAVPKPLGLAFVGSEKTKSEDKLSSNGVPSLVGSSQERSRDEKPRPTSNRISLTDSPRTKPGPESPKRIHEQVAAVAAKGQQPTAKPAEEHVEEPPSPRKLDMKRMSRFLDEANPAPPKAEPEKARPPSPVKASGRALPEPNSLAKQAPRDTVDSEPVVTVRNAAAVFGGLSGPSAASLPTARNVEPKPAGARSLAESAARPLPATPGSVAAPPRVTSPPVSSPARSPTKPAAEPSSLVADFFGPERPKRSYTADAAEILMDRPKAAPRIHTHAAQLLQISGDGKKLPVPGHYERVLFEREMYLCPHTFTNEAGKKATEVYFWAGDEVPESAVEDAQLFAGREARAVGGKLVKLRQGKETPEFIQALGGIAIVRRGSSNKYDSLAPNMLCGRRHLGQIVFDEVDFAPLSLCSGFPYIITQQGKVYLWKGKGSSVDELSCARLIGIELALTGEMVEVEDGQEPATFWHIFDGSTKPGSADHWRLKPNYDKYCARLFRSDAADRKQIIELSPFSQADLRPSGIYVLDAFFEMYVIVGSRSQAQYAAFHNALDFAQEYAILAASMEDRPFVPISTVVLEGIPRDLKSVFRKWRDGQSPTRMNTGGSPAGPNLRRARSLRIVPLNQALQALSE